MPTGSPRSWKGIAVEPSLAWLLHPLTVGTFLEEIWGAEHHHIMRCDANYFDRLLPGPSALDQLLQHVQPDPSAVRLVRGGEDREPAAYRLPDGSLDPERVQRHFADGYTIVFNGLERYVRAIAALSHSIEVELNFPTRVNAYVTPPESRGFVPHYDPHDVLVLQIHGCKAWHVSKDGAVAPHQLQLLQGVGTAALTSPTDVRLEAGDALYLPRGQVHSAETHAESSIHLTIGIHAPTVLTLIAHLLHALSLRDDRVHDRLSPRHLDDPDVRAGLGDLARSVLGAVTDPAVIAEGLAAMEDVLVRRGRCPPVGQIAATVGIDRQTLVAKHQPLYSRVARGPAGVELRFAQLSVNAGPDHEAAMLFLSRSTKPFRVHELPGLTAAQQTDLTGTLILNGFLVRLPDRPAAES